MRLLVITIFGIHLLGSVAIAEEMSTPTKGPVKGDIKQNFQVIADETISPTKGSAPITEEKSSDKDTAKQGFQVIADEIISPTKGPVPINK